MPLSTPVDVQTHEHANRSILSVVSGAVLLVVIVAAGILTFSTSELPWRQWVGPVFTRGWLTGSGQETRGRVEAPEVVLQFKDNSSEAPDPLEPEDEAPRNASMVDDSPEADPDEEGPSVTDEFNVTEEFPFDLPNMTSDDLGDLLNTTLIIPSNTTSNASSFVYRTCAERQPSNRSQVVQDFFFRQWHPTNCDTLTIARYSLPNSGLTARLNHLASGLLCAAVSGAILHLHHTNVYVNRRLCALGDFPCYFLPYSNCSERPQRSFINLPDHLQRHNITDCAATLWQMIGHPRDQPEDWLLKEAIQYYMRPNARLLQFVASVAEHQPLRDPYLAMHLRTGTRFTWQNEKKTFDAKAVDRNLQQMVTRAAGRGYKTIFFSSDSTKMLGPLVSYMTRAGLAIAVVPPHLFPTSQSPPNQRAEQYLATYYRTHRNDLDEGLAMLGTLVLFSQAAEAVVTHSSNVALMVRRLLWCGDVDPPVTFSFPVPYTLPKNKKRRRKA